MHNGIQQLGRNRHIGCEECQHRCHVGVNHTAPLGHTADMTYPALQRKGHCELFLKGVCGHDSLTCIASALHIQCRNQLLHVLFKRCNAQRLTNDSGRSNDDILCV